MAHTIATHEKRLLELNAKLDTKYRNVIQAVTEAAHKYPKKKAHKVQHWLTDGSPVESSKSRGVLTLNNNSPGPSLPLPPPGAAKRPIPLVEKGGCRIKELPLPKLAQMLKATGKDVSANVHITHDASSSDDNEPEESDQDAPIHEQFWNVHFSHTRESDCEIDQDARKDFIQSIGQSTSPNLNSTKPAKRSTKSTPQDVLPRKNISSEALIKFLKAKVSILQQDQEELKKEKALRLENETKLTEKLQQLSAEQERLQSQNKTLGAEVERLTKINSDSSADIKSKDQDLVHTRRLLGETRKELTQQSRTNALLERRLTKITEDLECVKKNLLSSKATAVDLQATQTKELGFAEKQLKMLAQQRDGLVAAYKRQLMLLDNLKRQNVCLQQAKLLEFVEQDFVKMLDWNQQSDML